MKRAKPRKRHFFKGGEAKKNSCDGLQDPSLELDRSDPGWRRLARRRIDASILIPDPEVYSQPLVSLDTLVDQEEKPRSEEITSTGKVLVDVSVELVTITLPELSANSATQQM